MAQCSHCYPRCHSNAGAAASADTANPLATESWHQLLKVLQIVSLLPYELCLPAVQLFLELFPQLKQEKDGIRIGGCTERYVTQREVSYFISHRQLPDAMLIHGHPLSGNLGAFCCHRKAEIQRGPSEEWGGESTPSFAVDLNTHSPTWLSSHITVLNSQSLRSQNLLQYMVRKNWFISNFLQRADGR